jgi:hypothetical protein
MGKSVAHYYHHSVLQRMTQHVVYGDEGMMETDQVMPSVPRCRGNGDGMTHQEFRFRRPQGR